MLTAILVVFIYNRLLLLAGVACLIYDATKGKKTKAYGLEPWHAKTFDFCTFFFGLYVMQLLLQSFALKVFSSVVGEDASWAYSTGCGMLAGYLGVLILFIVARKQYPESFDFPLSPARLGVGKSLGKAFFYYLSALPLISIASVAWSTLLTTLNEHGFNLDIPFQETVEKMSELKSPSEFAVLFLVIVVGAPLVEELLFRGVLYRFLKGRTQPWIALTISSLIFASIHFSILQFIPLFLLGMLLGRAYERTGSLRVPIAMHAIFNLITTLNVTIAPELLKM